jgi:hypothetical protein
MATRKKTTRKKTATRKKATTARKKTAAHKKTATRKKSTTGRKKTTARKKSSGRRKYSPASGEYVRNEMDEYNQGTARSGRSGGKVKSRKQAIAIGLSEARRAGKKVPARAGGRKKKS